METGASDGDDRLARLRLSLVDGLGPTRQRALLAAFGSALRALAADKPRLEAVEGIGPKLADAIQNAPSEATARELRERMARLGVREIHESDDDYPSALREIAQPPALLFARGSILARDQVAVAIVGSRQCTAYGKRMAALLARELALRGVTIVSGLARGIDAAAHQAALEAGGRTLAVLASGLANVYPPEHVDLAEDVVRAGALLTEAPLDGKPIGGLFPQRNRIISGLSLGVIVVEASARSGALSTAFHALDQNREVFAVPGRVGDPASEGALRLIQQGAALVACGADVLERLGPIDVAPAARTPASSAPPPPSLTDVELQLWMALGEDPTALETLLERTGLRASEASATLLMMEMRKLVRRLPGNQYARA